jgi:hypothetical protein
MLLIDELKVVLRVSNRNFAFDNGEIEPLIEAARHELKLSGIASDKLKLEVKPTLLEDIDPLIKRAITIYVKANFGWDNPDSEKLMSSFETLKSHLSMSGDYNAIS